MSMHGKESEEEFQQAIITLAEYAGWRGYHVENVTKHLRNSTAVGFPDWVLAHRRKGIIFAELKDATRPPTEEQVEWLRRAP